MHQSTCIVVIVIVDIPPDLWLGKNGERGKLGQDMLYVGCCDFMLLFNVCSLVLMIYWDIVRGGLGS